MRRLDLLNAGIPSGGRQLTSAECRGLRAKGVRCSPSWLVMPNGTEHVGVAYAPCKTGGYDNTQIMLRTKQKEGEGKITLGKVGVKLVHRISNPTLYPVDICAQSVVVKGVTF